MIEVIAPLKSVAGYILATGAGVLSPLAFSFAKKLIARNVRKGLEEGLKRALDPKIADPALKEKAKAFVKAGVDFAEELLPDSGLGPERKKLLMEGLRPILGKYADEGSELIEVVLKEADTTLKESK